MDEEKKNEELDVNNSSSDDLTLENIDNETFTYTVDNNNIGSDYKGKNSDSKNSFIYIFIGLFILIAIIVLLIIFVNKSPKATGYSDIENKMVSAAKNYYKDNEDLFSNEDGSSMSIDAQTLINEGYLKSFKELLDDETISCSGTVEIYKAGSEYSYFPVLNCGDDYTSERLSDSIKASNLVTEGSGLYAIGDEFVFRGEYPNNYVSFDDKVWRIIKINSNGSIKLVLGERVKNRYVWDDRFNSISNSYSGINDFRVSRILEYLKEQFDGTDVISKKNKGFLVKGSWCIGKLSEDDVRIDSIDLCSDVYDDLYIGLLQADEVLKPSIDANCINIYDQECTNYNYFSFLSSSWTMNASASNSHKVFLASSGSVSYRNASLTNYMIPVININGDILYKKGSGTIDDPYVIGS